MKNTTTCWRKSSKTMRMYVSQPGMVLYALPLTVRAEEPETILEFSGNTVSYASVKPDGGLKLQKAWDGYELVRRADGNCYRIDHTNLRIENVGLGQRVQSDEAVVPTSCH